MEKKIEDFIHFYVGSNILHENGTTARIIYAGEIVGFINNDNGQFGDCKAEHIDPPLLRPLSSMTKEELRELKWNRNDELKHATSQSNPSLYLSEFKYLLSKGFDLFGLIEAGHAIDSNK